MGLFEWLRKTALQIRALLIKNVIQTVRHSHRLNITDGCSGEKLAHDCLNFRCTHLGVFGLFFVAALVCCVAVTRRYTLSIVVSKFVSDRI